MSKAVSIIYQPVEKLETIGPRRAAALNKIGIYKIIDLFYYFPRRYLDRSDIGKIATLKTGQVTTVIGRVVNYEFKRGKRNRFQLYVTDGTSYLTCIWFSKFTYWQRIFKPGEWLALNGKISRYNGFQMVHPEFDRLGDNAEGELVHTGKIIPLYPSSEALTNAGFDSRGFRRIFVKILKIYKDKVEETIPQDIINRQKLIPLSSALENIHFPASVEMLEKAKQRLKFDELFFMELLIALRKNNVTNSSGGIRFKKVGDRVRSLIEKLPFELTDAQKKVIHEIHDDMKSSKPMNRLLQGDVGSGKTIVALITMLIAVENGYQAALMAPTEILAEQHYLTLYETLHHIGVKIILLVGAQNKTERQKVLDDIANQNADIIVGTHALIQENVDFHNLGLVVIDEQHRFGVMQRAKLREKSLNPDVLVMTATPIPRTLSMTVYGDLDVSILNEMPTGRKPIITQWRPNQSRAKIYRFVRDHVAKGAQTYIVFPLVEETEKSDLKAASDSYEKMKGGYFSQFKLGLLHGRMKSEEKESVMATFKAGDIQILISTTVIEVGVDVPNATIMVVEHAERFGITQLHQLRGRVGRGDLQSYCILIGYGRLSAEARKRLDTMASTNDGFKLAEIDLELRGPGEFFGTKQHGLPDLKIANVVKDIQLLRQARKEAFTLVEHDPQLSHEEMLGTRHYFLRNYRDKYDLAWVG
ncbi:ATP-dependent DNA helicase RecG [candidate division KSB1 bacterium]|nr:ATP-dependent DNA helicase RecG [candidate division KSB1 bacterium]